jgi:hypothetical protein
VCGIPEIDLVVGREFITKIGKNTMLYRVEPKLITSRATLTLQQWLAELLVETFAGYDMTSIRACRNLFFQYSVATADIRAFYDELSRNNQDLDFCVGLVGQDASGLNTMVVFVRKGNNRHLHHEDFCVSGAVPLKLIRIPKGRS